MTGVPPGPVNWPFQRSMLASGLPPWPAPKKYTAHSPPAWSPGAGGIVYVAARIGAGPWVVQPAGAVHCTPAVDSASTADGIRATDSSRMSVRMGRSVCQICSDRAQRRVLDARPEHGEK